MADIFISYSQADRAEVSKLAAQLEAEGWSVWYDGHLTTGGTYRDEIMRELVAARAVLVLWTRTSVASDFVRAEAGRAKADGKLIPIKTADVGYAEIPLPFGEMHTENLSNQVLVRAALLAQLAKPAVQPSALWLASATVRYQALTWIGIIGGAITLFSNLSGVLALADWARWITTHWREWTLWFWGWSFGWFGFNLPKPLGPLLSLIAFSLATAIGARRFATADQLRPSRDWLSLLILWAASMAAIYGAVLLSNQLQLVDGDAAANGLIFVLVLMAFAAIYLSRQRLMLGLFLAIFLLSFSIIFGTNINGFFDLGTGLARGYLEAIEANLPLAGRWLRIMLAMLLVSALCAPLFFVPALMLWICPVEALARRMVFFVGGVATLVILNTLSNYGALLRALLTPPT